MSKIYFQDVQYYNRALRQFSFQFVADHQEALGGRTMLHRGTQ